VLLKAGMSLDGKIATAKGESRWITGEEARHDARLLRGQCDGLLLGAGTVASDDPELFPAAGSPFGPARFLFDPAGRLDLSLGIFQQARKAQLPPVWWLVGPQASPAKRAKAEAMGVKVQAFEASDPETLLPAVLKWMNSLPIRRLMVEGGSRTLGLFLKLGFAEELALYAAPMVLGGQDSLAAFGGPGPAKLKQGRRLKDLKVAKVGEDLKITGRFA
jgi:diaminohydroxyphosphoribosylaminopyrimidine deaminase/5-amino-6-(5-phosphoribosylamino)uracil reductase